MRALDRITKTQALKALQKGETISLCPSKMYPNNPWLNGGCPIGGDGTKWDKSRLDEAVRNFKWYNCTSETGQAVHYYTVEK